MQPTGVIPNSQRMPANIRKEGAAITEKAKKNISVFLSVQNLKLLG